MRATRSDYQHELRAPWGGRGLLHETSSQPDELKSDDNYTNEEDPLGLPTSNAGPIRRGLPLEIPSQFTQRRGSHLMVPPYSSLRNPK
eukprot:1395079-Pyramimonas_sp.AAC.1